MSDVTIDMATNHMQVHQKKAEDWKITLVNTGEDTMTGGRLKRIKEYVENETAFFLTYGDGVSDIDITATLDFHHKHGKWATVTAVQPPGRFGVLNLQDSQVVGFAEKPAGKEALINGGFFVLSPKCIDLIENDNTVWEQGSLSQLTDMGELMAYEHIGFWQPMDTLRDKNYLEELWVSGRAPWKKW
jgi:glucose-1-phosphate cytidylyltransferase